MRQQMVDMYKQVSDAASFVRGDGTRLHSLKALEMALYTMTDGEFYHHVSNSRNDFSSWVLHVFGQKELSQKIASAKTRIDMLAVFDEVSRVARSASLVSSSSPNIPSRVATQVKSSPAVVSSKSSPTVAQNSKVANTSVKPTKSFHHKLKGMFKKGDSPVTSQNAHSYEAALANAKASAVTQARSPVAHAHGRTIHEQINHLDSQLAHMTRHHAHTTARDDVGSSLLEESVKERILDFSLGLIVGLMLGFILAKSLGLA